MDRGFFPFVQRIGLSFEKVLRDHVRAFFLVIGFCVFISLFQEAQGKEAWVTNSALCEITAIWLCFDFVVSLAKQVSLLPSLAHQFVELLRVPARFERFSLLDDIDFSVLDSIRAFIFPPPAAPTAFSRV